VTPRRPIPKLLAHTAGIGSSVYHRRIDPEIRKKDGLDDFLLDLSIKRQTHLACILRAVQVDERLLLRKLMKAECGLFIDVTRRISAGDPRLPL
jgi:hypothetical protein